jgi:hypothetical protein
MVPAPARAEAETMTWDAVVPRECGGLRELLNAERAKAAAIHTSGRAVQELLYLEPSVEYHFDAWEKMRRGLTAIVASESAARMEEVSVPKELL